MRRLGDGRYHCSFGKHQTETERCFVCHPPTIILHFQLQLVAAAVAIESIGVPRSVVPDFLKCRMKLQRWHRAKNERGQP